MSAERARRWHLGMVLFQLLILTIFLVAPPHVNVNIASPCIVGTVEVAKLC